ncbi:hypothetical protein L8N14_015275, partial [Serratia marcescens]|nr:hypothetical protein [Serratia marcescens]
KVGSSVEALNDLIESQRANKQREGLGFAQEQDDKRNKGKAPMVDKDVPVVDLDVSTSKQPRKQVEKPIHAKQNSVKFTPHKFPGYCFSCNKYGHMARMCHSRNARISHPNFASENVD